MPQQTIVAALPAETANAASRRVGSVSDSGSGAGSVRGLPSSGTSSGISGAGWAHMARPRLRDLAVAGWRRRLPAASQLQWLLSTCSEILFVKGWLAGLILVGVSLLQPPVGMAGLVAVAAALLFARLAGIGADLALSGAQVYNPLLTGLCAGLLLGIAPLGLLVAATAGVLAFAVTVVLQGVFDDYLRLPVLSLPFVLVAAVVWLAFAGHTGLLGAVPSLPPPLPPSFLIDFPIEFPMGAGSFWLPHWLDGMLTALGALVFTPHPLAGLILALVILLHSRILFTLAVAGYLLGASLSAVLAGDASARFDDINYFNHMLVAMSVGGIYLVPSLRSAAIAAVAVAASALVLAATEVLTTRIGVPVFTLPFIVVTLSFLYLLGRTAAPVMAKTLHDTPEQTRDHHLSHHRRFGDPLAELSLPFFGSWTLWQGFNGPWTHQGPWQHACDFIITRPVKRAGETDAGQTYVGKTDKGPLGYAGSGERLEDYHAWRKPVLAPCAGRVVRVISALPDNPPGQLDERQRWGNLVIIESGLGWFAELSHFAQASIAVKEGDQVEAGQLLGLCGNSGYSAQPHIHLQVQATAEVGAATQPFRLLGFLQANRFTARGLPSVGGQVRPLPVDRGLQARLTFPLGETLCYRCTEGARDAGLIALTARMDALGRTFLESGKGRLYHATDPSGFYFYRIDGTDPWLAMLFQAMPHLPLGYSHEMVWSDLIPMAAVACGSRSRLRASLAELFSLPRADRFIGHWGAEGVVEGRLSSVGNSGPRRGRVELSPRRGLSKVQLDDRVMTLQPDTGATRCDRHQASDAGG